MAGDSLGKIFKVTSWGESHGKAIGVVVEGCPAKIRLDLAKIQNDLSRRRPGQSKITTQRNELDKLEILSGLINGETTGAPLSIIIYNKDQKSPDYSKLKEVFRPSHADYTYFKKYGIRDPYGGGRSSARITAGWVAAGSIAKQVLEKSLQSLSKDAVGVKDDASGKFEILAYVKSIKDLECQSEQLEQLKITHELIESSPVRCPDLKLAQEMEALILKTMKAGDSLGGVIECRVSNPPIGLGEPIFDKLEADLAKAMLLINAVKGFEIGSGFAGSKMLGSEHNDVFQNVAGKISTSTNFSGGIQGGISNGMPIVFKVAFKPTSTILKPQKSIDLKESNVEFSAQGRHDPCVVPRAVPIVEAMTALVLLDHYLRNKMR